MTSVFGYSSFHIPNVYCALGSQHFECGSTGIRSRYLCHEPSTLYFVEVHPVVSQMTLNKPDAGREGITVDPYQYEGTFFFLSPD